METRLSKNPFTQFQYPWLKRFMELCKLIEQDKNYQPDIKSPNELLSLVKDENDNPKHSPIKTAMAILPVPAEHAPLSLDGDTLGVLYQVAVTKAHYLGEWGFGKPYNWRVESEHVIFVSKSGEISIHLIKRCQE